MISSKRYLELNNQIGLLKELVEMNSSSTNRAGVSHVQECVAEQLRNLGFDLVFEANPATDRCGEKLLIAELSLGGSKDPFVNLVTHADTVFESEADLPKFRIDNERLVGIGPGVIDDKGGIVVALSGICRYLRQKEANLNLRFICSPSEEIGSPGFQKIFQDLSVSSKMVLAFEPGMENGSIIESRRGNRWYEINVEGQAGHSGRDHKRGINAAHELAHKVTHFHSLTDYEKDLTLNVGEVSGGSKFNIICGHAHAKLDVRFSDIEMRDHAHCEIERIINTSFIGINSEGNVPKSGYKIVDDCPPLAKKEESCFFIQKYLDIVEEVEGKPIQATQSGGTADCNYMSREGLAIIDGLGATGGGMHTLSEYVHIRSLETRSESLNRFLQLVSLC